MDLVRFQRDLRGFRYLEIVAKSLILLVRLGNGLIWQNSSNLETSMSLVTNVLHSIEEREIVGKIHVTK